MTALAVILTWVFNNTRGSVLLAMLLYASINAAPGMLLPLVFPTLARFGPTWMLVWLGAAVFVIAATRGRLSCQRYLHDADKSAPSMPSKQACVEGRRTVMARPLSERGICGGSAEGNACRL